MSERPRATHLDQRGLLDPTDDPRGETHVSQQIQDCVNPGIARWRGSRERQCRRSRAVGAERGGLGPHRGIKVSQTMNMNTSGRQSLSKLFASGTSRNIHRLLRAQRGHLNRIRDIHHRSTSQRLTQASNNVVDRRAKRQSKKHNISRRDSRAILSETGNSARRIGRLDHRVVRKHHIVCNRHIVDNHAVFHRIAGILNNPPQRLSVTRPHH